MATTRTLIRRTILAGIVATVLPAVFLPSAALASVTSNGFAAGSRIDLRVLVVTAGDPGTDAMTTTLDAYGVPYTVVDVAAAGRPVIDAAFLADNSGSTPRAKFEAIVLPNEGGGGLGADELTALATYETTFHIREMDSYVYPSPDLGYNYPVWSGSPDGFAGTATAAAKADSFRYLAGPVPIDNADPTVDESYGYLATPNSSPVAGSTFTPLVTTEIPGGLGTGVLVGAYSLDGRERVSLPFAVNRYMQDYQLLEQGLLDWLTRGTRLGYNRHYFAVQVDDVFNANNRWDTVNHENCDETLPTCAGSGLASTVRMNAGDVTYLKNWEAAHNFKIDLAYNAGFAERSGSLADPLTAALVTNKTSFRWINHTYNHLYYGCQRDESGACIPDPAHPGQPLWVSKAMIKKDVQRGFAFANRADIQLPVNRTELVSGEHGGLARPGEGQPDDNPNFIQALKELRIRYTGSDYSIDTTGQRDLGTNVAGRTMRTVPRHPMNIYYQTSTKAEEVDEYKWIYNSAADGGACTGGCLPAIDLATGYDTVVVPNEVRIALSHVLANDPAPHYAHQPNLMIGAGHGDGVLYPVLEGVLAGYADLFATNTPIVNQTHTEAGEASRLARTWADAASDVTAYYQDGVVHVSSVTAVSVPVTVPQGSVRGTSMLGPAFGTSYAGERSAFATVSPSGPLTISLP